MHPRHSSETISPVFPRRAYSIRCSSRISAAERPYFNIRGLAAWLATHGTRVVGLVGSSSGGLQGSDAGRLRDPRVSRIPSTAVLACWALGALVFAFLPQDSGAKSVIATVFSLSTAAFAAVILLRAARGGPRAGLPAAYGTGHGLPARRELALERVAILGFWLRHACGPAGRRLRHLILVAGRGDASPGGADHAQDHAGQRPRRRSRHALSRDAGLVLRPRSRGGRGRAGKCTRGRGCPLPACLRRGPALPGARGRLVPGQTPFLHVSERGFRGAAPRRCRLPGTSLRRAVPERQLAREVVGSMHDPARPHVDNLS